MAVPVDGHDSLGGDDSHNVKFPPVHSVAQIPKWESFMGVAEVTLSLDLSVEDL